MKKIINIFLCFGISFTLFFTSSASAFTAKDVLINRNVEIANSIETDTNKEMDSPDFSVVDESSVAESQEEKAAREQEETHNAAINEEESSGEGETPELEVGQESQNLTVRRVGNEIGNATPTIRRVIRLSSERRPRLNFEEMINLQNYDYLEKVLEMAQFFQESVDTNTLEFNVDKAVQSIKQRPDLILNNVLNQNINKGSAQPTVVADELVNYLGTIGVNISPDKKAQYTNIIASAFSNLQNKKQGAWIFWNKATAKSCSYNYNILFAIQDESTGNKLVTVPVALKITVNVVKEKILFIKIREKHSYNVNIKALRVTYNNEKGTTPGTPITTLPDRPIRDPRTGGGSRRDPGTGGGSRRDPGTGGGSRRDPGTGGGSRRDPETGGGSRRGTGTSDIPLKNPRVSEMPNKEI